MKATISRIARAVLCAAIFAGTVLFASCSPRAVLTVGEGGTGSANFSEDMSSQAESVVRRFTGAKSDLFDKKAIADSLSRAGIKVDSVSFPSPSGMRLGLSVAKIDGLLGHAIAYSAKDRTVSVTISRDSVHAALATMPATMNDYIDLLMAPAFTGETLSQAEYIDVVRSAYGKTIADELLKSDFTLAIHCPAPIRQSKIDAPGSASTAGNEATFRIPLAALLAMEKPIAAQASW